MLCFFPVLYLVLFRAEEFDSVVFSTDSPVIPVVCVCELVTLSHSLADTVT